MEIENLPSFDVNSAKCFFYMVNSKTGKHRLFRKPADILVEDDNIFLLYRFNKK